MKSFYLWVAVLTSEYEPIITSSLAKLGYEVNKVSQQTTNRFLDYRLDHVSKTIQEVEANIYKMINDHKLIIHGYLVSEYQFNQKIMWRGSNINFDKANPEKEIPAFKKSGPPKIKPSENEGIEDVMAHLNQILDRHSNKIREDRAN